MSSFFYELLVSILSLCWRGQHRPHDEQKTSTRTNAKADRTTGIKRLNNSLYSLYEPANLNAELVFFHGIAHGACEDMHIRAWTNSSGEIWPAEWLPKEPEFQRARILSVHYDSSLMKTNDAGVFSMNNLVESLAWDLISEWEANVGQRGLPVVLTGHDIGGLVIKELCVYLEAETTREKEPERRRKIENFLKNLRGVFYFSTPHQGVEIADGTNFDGGLSENVKLLNARSAVMNENFRRIREKRRWGTASLAHLIEEMNGSVRLPEATMRYDTDFFMTEQKIMGDVNRPDSLLSSGFLYFVSCIKGFVQDQLDEDRDEKFEKEISNKVGLRSRVDQVVSLFSSLEKARGKASGVVLHGMAGIGKSTLGDVVFLKLSRWFDPDCRCSVDREAITNPNRPLSELQQAILESFRSDRPPSDRKQILEALKKCYRKADRPLLIFVDNIEKEEELEHIFPDVAIDDLPQGSCILLASRNLDVYRKLSGLFPEKVCFYRVKELEEDIAQELFLKSFRSNLAPRVKQSWGAVQEVLQACGGLPLALRVVGGALNEVHPSEWSRTIERLRKWIPLGGSKDDTLMKSLEFSYNQLDPEDLAPAFLDVVFCFSGSPWEELRLMYGDKLELLERRALIMKNRRLDCDLSLEVPTVKVHALFVVLGKKECRTRESYFRLHVRKDISARSGEASSYFSDLYLHGILSKRKNCCDVLILDGNPLNPSDVEHECTQLGRMENTKSSPTSMMKKLLGSLRILILRDVFIPCTFGGNTIPENLECFICCNSNVPFREGDFTGLKKLKHVEITTRVDCNDDYKFPNGVRKVRLENENVKHITFAATEEQQKSLKLEEIGLMSVTNRLLHVQLNHFIALKKVVLINISGLDNNLPESLFQMRSLRSLSIQYCTRVSRLPDFYMGELEHLHLALPELIALPDSIENLGVLKSLTLERCRLLGELPAGIDARLMPKLQHIAIHRCPGLRSPPTGFLKAPPVRESTDLQLRSDLKREWHQYTREQLDSTLLSSLLEDNLSATQMPPLISRSKWLRQNDHVFQLSPGAPPADVDIILFHGLQRPGIEIEDAYWKTWKLRQSDDCWLETLLPGLLVEFARSSQDCPKAPTMRVLSVSYEKLDLGKSTAPDGNFRERGVVEDYVLAENLIQDLIFDSLVNAGQNGPMFLLGHDLGGIFIKLFLISVEQTHAIQYECDRKQKLHNFLRNLKGVHVFANPHSGAPVQQAVAETINFYGIGDDTPISEFELGDPFEFFNRAACARLRLGTSGESVPVDEEGIERPGIDYFTSYRQTDHFTECQPEGTHSLPVRRLAQEIIRSMEERQKLQPAVSQYSTKQLVDIPEREAKKRKRC
ncbi:hypothetical protein R1sor_015285 [Riccia sorocarpa]|uniref:NB-ARC domain-containing protein n=1 Tax=Riccia sorocarpa TaxID=122646 RepID=A0ABD3HG20_9MARC